MEFAFPVETLWLVQFVRSFQNTEGSTSSPGRYSLALKKRPGDEVAEGSKQFEVGVHFLIWHTCGRARTRAGQELMCSCEGAQKEPQNRVLNNGVFTVVSTEPCLIFCPKQCAETEGVVPCRVSVYLSFSPCPNQELGPPFLFTFSSIRLVVCCSLVLTVFVRTCSKTLL